MTDVAELARIVLRDGDSAKEVWEMEREDGRMVRLGEGGMMVRV